MRTIFLFLTLQFALNLTSFCQSTFGWNLVLEGTRYKTLMPEGTEFFSAQQQKKAIPPENFSNLIIGIGEPIIVIDNYKGGVIALDPKGRLLFIESKKTLLPVTQFEFVTVGALNEEFSTLDGTVYKRGRYVLIIGQSLEKNSYTVLFDKDKKLEIASSKIILEREYFSNYIDVLPFQTAEN